MTSLFSGERVPKDLLRVEAYGDVDELNSVLGALSAALPRETSQLIQEVRQIQSDLFHIGAWLATTPDSPYLSLLKKISGKDTEALERAIDRMNDELPDLKGFIIPGGHASAAWTHFARTVCRRTERHVVRLAADYGEAKEMEQLNEVIIYLNRLSDYLFVLARYCNHRMGVPDTHWEK